MLLLGMAAISVAVACRQPAGSTSGASNSAVASAGADWMQDDIVGLYVRVPPNAQVSDSMLTDARAREYRLPGLLLRATYGTMTGDLDLARHRGEPEYSAGTTPANGLEVRWCAFRCSGTSDACAGGDPAMTYHVIACLARTDALTYRPFFEAWCASPADVDLAKRILFGVRPGYRYLEPTTQQPPAA